MTINATIHVEGEQLTEDEVFAAARSIVELKNLRALQNHNATGTINVRGTSYGLMSDEVDAILALLIERHSVLITGLGIKLDQPSL